MTRLSDARGSNQVTRSRESFHVLHPTGDDVPMPMTLYLSREIMMDDVITDEQRATLLRRDLEFVIGHYRKRLLEGADGA